MCIHFWYISPYKDISPYKGIRPYKGIIIYVKVACVNLVSHYYKNMFAI